MQTQTKQQTKTTLATRIDVIVSKTVVLPIATDVILAPESFKEMRHVGFGQLSGLVLKEELNSVSQAISAHVDRRAGGSMVHGISAEIPKDQGQQRGIRVRRQPCREGDAGLEPAVRGAFGPWLPCVRERLGEGNIRPLENERGVFRASEVEKTQSERLHSQGCVERVAPGLGALRHGAGRAEIDLGERAQFGQWGPQFMRRGRGETAFAGEGRFEPGEQFV